MSQAKKDKIFNSDATQLRALLIKRELTSVDLVNYFSERCYTIGRKNNYLTEEFYNVALELAKVKDQQIDEAISNETTDQLGLLHGIPISIKDHVKKIPLKFLNFLYVYII